MILSTAIIGPRNSLKRAKLLDYHFLVSGLRCIASSTLETTVPKPTLPELARKSLIPKTEKTHRRIRIAQPLKSIRSTCAEPLKTFQSAQISLLDPASSRTRLFAKDNVDAASVGDVILARFKTGEPFAGVCLSIRRRGVDTAILLRNQFTRVGTELWVKIYSPLVTGIEIIQRAEKRPRRARLYYMRKPKHDRGSLASLVDEYNRTRSALGAGAASVAAAGTKRAKMKTGKSGSPEGKKGAKS